MKSKLVFIYEPNGNALRVVDNGDKVYQGSVATTEFYLKMASDSLEDGWSYNDGVFINLKRSDGRISGPLLMMRSDDGWIYTSNGWLEDVDLYQESVFEVSFTMRKYSLISGENKLVSTRTTESVTISIFPSARWTPMDIVNPTDLESIVEELETIADKIDNFSVGEVNTVTGLPNTSAKVDAEIVTAKDNRLKLNMDFEIPQGIQGKRGTVIYSRQVLEFDPHDVESFDLPINSLNIVPEVGDYVMGMMQVRATYPQWHYVTYIFTAEVYAINETNASVRIQSYIETTGSTGMTGPVPEIGIAAVVGSNTGNPTVKVTEDGNPPLYPHFLLEFDGLKGESGGMVSGVKGNQEKEYRIGDVNLTPANLGAISKTDFFNVSQTDIGDYAKVFSSGKAVGSWDNISVVFIVSDKNSTNNPIGCSGYRVCYKMHGLNSPPTIHIDRLFGDSTADNCLYVDFVNDVFENNRNYFEIYWQSQYKGDDSKIIQILNYSHRQSAVMNDYTLYTEVINGGEVVSIGRFVAFSEVIDVFSVTNKYLSTNYVPKTAFTLNGTELSITTASAEVTYADYSRRNEDNEG